MTNPFYQIAINTRLQQVDFPRYLQQAEKYHKVLKDAGKAFGKTGQMETPEAPETPVFVMISEKPEVCVVFYKNLFFSYSYCKDSMDRVFRIYMKRPEDKWELPKNPDGTLDALNPVNVKAEVYIAYNVNVLNVDRCVGERYKPGPWDKTFYKTLKSFVNEIEGYTETKQIEVAYEN